MKMLERLKEKNSVLYLIVAFFSFIILDFVFRKIFISYSMMKQYDRIPLFFVLGWSLVFCGIIHVLSGKIKKIIMIFSILFFCILTLIHSSYMNLFNKFFSFSDMALASEGAKFMDLSYIHIRKIMILTVLIVIFLMIISVCLVPKTKSKSNIIVGVVLLFIGAGCIFFSENQFESDPDGMAWDAALNPSVVYDDFIDTPKCLLMSGLYQYTFKDMKTTFNPLKHFEEQETLNDIEEYYSSVDNIHEKNEKTNLFKGKNLILIQLENIDTWMLTEENMPNLYALKEQSIDFTNHYSIAYATGKTFNTEFIVNTGQIPRPSGDSPSDIYIKNEYPFALAKLFRNKNYTANSFHGASGTIYNRAKAHDTFGYEAYHSYADMNMNDYTMDSQMINGYELMIKETPYFSFVITYSGHSPFSEDTSAAKVHLSKVQSEQEEITDSTYLLGLAQAKETDKFVGSLIEKLKKDNQLENTVIAFYTDHYAYSTIDKELEYQLKGTNDPNLLSNTPFFIYSNGEYNEKISKVTNSSDILPTLANLFGLDLEYKYCVGYDAFDKDYIGYAMFSDYSWYDGKNYWKPNENNSETTYNKELTESINKKLQISWGISDTDYFRHKGFHSD